MRWVNFCWDFGGSLSFFSLASSGNSDSVLIPDSQGDVGLSALCKMEAPSSIGFVLFILEKRWPLVKGSHSVLSMLVENDAMLSFVVEDLLASIGPVELFVVPSAGGPIWLRHERDHHFLGRVHHSFLFFRFGLGLLRLFPLRGMPVPLILLSRYLGLRQCLRLLRRLSLCLLLFWVILFKTEISLAGALSRAFWKSGDCVLFLNVS